MTTFWDKRRLSIVAICLVGAAWCGCGSEQRNGKVVQGSVVCGETKVPLGTVRFVSVDGGSPTRIASITDGRYCVNAKDVLQLGKWRVEVDARQKTGKKAKRFIGTDTALVDEEARLGPPLYAGQQSPLTVDVTADFNGTFDIAIPQR